MTLRLTKKLGISLAVMLGASAIDSASHASCVLRIQSANWFYNSDHEGGDYRSIPFSSGGLDPSLSCSSYCDEDSHCVAWTYVSSNSTCYLKDQITAMVAAPGMTTGRRFEPDTNYDGSDYREIFNASRPGICHAACLEDYRACKAWTWVEINETCYLKDSIPSASSVQGMISARYDLQCNY